jgi:hypothetical protein
MPMPRRPNDFSRDPIQQIIADISGTTGLPTTGQPNLQTLRQGFSNQINKAFPGDAFSSFDDNIINSILDERQQKAGAGIGRMQARGNFNPMGASTAFGTLTGQREKAGDTLRELGGGILSQNREDISGIRDRALSAAEGYKLGDDLFNVTPFAEERSNLINERMGTLGNQLRDVSADVPLFNPMEAMQAGSKSQGLVSGPTSQTGFLDEMARQNQYGSGRLTRGGGNTGSGVF